jgi:hypothetical protein
MKKTLLFAALALFVAGLAFGGTITVTQPTAGDKVMGSSLQIAWTSSGVAGNFKIQLIRPGGALVGLLLNNVAASPQNWTIAAPAVVGEQYKIRVRSMDLTTTGESATFTVVADGGGDPGDPGDPGSPGTITNVHFNTASPYCFGTAYTISWTVTGVTQHLKLQLIHSGGALVTAINGDMAPGTSSQGWTPTTPAIAPGVDYKVRVSTLDNSVTAESAVFELKTGDCGGDDDGDGPIDPHILDKLRHMRYMIKFKWPPEPDPCFCPDFDLSKLRQELGDLRGNVRLVLLKNGLQVQEFGVFGRGKAMPVSMKPRLSAENYGLLTQGGAKFSLGLIGENGKILDELALEGAAQGAAIQ